MSERERVRNKLIHSQIEREKEQKRETLRDRQARRERERDG